MEALQEKISVFNSLSDERFYNAVYSFALEFKCNCFLNKRIKYYKQREKYFAVFSYHIKE